MALSALTRKFGMTVALTHKDFRLYWVGYVSSVTGMQMFMVVQVWLVFALTGSALQLGFLGLARLLPALVLGPAGGVAADKVNKRHLLMATTMGVAAAYLVLATLVLTGAVQVWHILTAVFISSAFQAFDQPSRQAIFPHLIDRRNLMSAVALNSAIHPGTRIFAPIIAGLLIDHLGVPRVGAATVIYLVSGAYLIFTYMMFRVYLPPIERVGAGNPIQELVDGFRYILDRPVYRILVGSSFINAFFGMAHITLVPVFAQSLLGEASGSGIGLLLSSAGLGGLMGAIVGGSLGQYRRRGWLMVGGTTTFGVTLIAFAFSPLYGLSVALEWLGSVSLQLFSVTAQSTLHSLVPDEYRGRVIGLWGMTHSLMQPLGGLSMGAAANSLSAPLVVAVGGGAVALWGLLGIGSSKQVRRMGSEADAPSAEAVQTPAREV